MDFASTLYGPVYGILGVPAIITVAGVAYGLTVIDKTDGFPVGSPIEVQAMVPGAAVRLTDLAAAIRVSDQAVVPITLAQLDDSTIAFNGKTWTIRSHLPKPAPDGTGEVYLILEG
jgi:hypothetical protein